MQINIKKRIGHTSEISPKALNGTVVIMRVKIAKNVVILDINLRLFIKHDRHL